MKPHRNGSSIIVGFAAAFALCTIMAGCKSDSVSPSTTGSNTPVIANASNAFSFIIAANNYSSNYNSSLSFTKDSLAISITSANYSSGKVLLSIADSSGSVIVQDSVMANKVVAETLSGKGIPKECTIICQNYSGSLVFALAGQNGQK